MEEWHALIFKELERLERKQRKGKLGDTDARCCMRLSALIEAEGADLIGVETAKARSESLMSLVEDGVLREAAALGVYGEDLMAALVSIAKFEKNNREK